MLPPACGLTCSPPYLLPSSLIVILPSLLAHLSSYLPSLPYLLFYLLTLPTCVFPYLSVNLLALLRFCLLPCSSAFCSDCPTCFPICMLLCFYLPPSLSVSPPPPRHQMAFSSSVCMAAVLYIGLFLGLSLVLRLRPFPLISVCFRLYYSLDLFSLSLSLYRSLLLPFSLSLTPPLPTFHSETVFAFYFSRSSFYFSLYCPNKHCLK